MEFIKYVPFFALPEKYRYTNLGYYWRPGFIAEVCNWDVDIIADFYASGHIMRLQGKEYRKCKRCGRRDIKLRLTSVTGMLQDEFYDVVGI